MAYFEAQNKKYATTQSNAYPLHLDTLGIVNGW